MRLKTLDGSGNIALVDYPEEEFRKILLERGAYVLERVHEYGDDYGGSQCTDEREVTFEEIGPELVLVENGHFCGVVMYTDYDYMNGGFRNYAEEVIIFADRRGKTGRTRSGSMFSNDDHSRWDYVDYDLVTRASAEKSPYWKA